MNKFLLLSCVILFALVSCGKDSPDSGLAGGSGGDVIFADKLSVSSSSALFSAEGGEVSVTVLSPGLWFLAPKSYDWVSVNMLYGTSGDVVTFTAEPNAGSELRGPVEFVFTSNKESVKFIVTQTAF